MTGRKTIIFQISRKSFDISSNFRFRWQQKSKKTFFVTKKKLTPKKYSPRAYRKCSLCPRLQKPKENGPSEYPKISAPDDCFWKMCLRGAPCLKSELWGQEHLQLFYTKMIDHFVLFLQPKPKTIILVCDHFSLFFFVAKNQNDHLAFFASRKKLENHSFRTKNMFSLESVSIER